VDLLQDEIRAIFDEILRSAPFEEAKPNNITSSRGIICLNAQLSVKIG
jgi:hypothetical protein